MISEYLQARARSRKRGILLVVLTAAVAAGVAVLNGLQRGWRIYW